MEHVGEVKLAKIWSVNNSPKFIVLIMTTTKTGDNSAHISIVKDPRTSPRHNLSKAN